MVRGGTIINIAGTTPVDDPEYRYKMPAVYGKIEGAGNGIKTAIPNISAVATSLHRSPGEVNKFFGCELGAQTTYAPDTDRAIVNGAHNDTILQDLVHKYIERFVCCPNCGLPETDYKIKSEIIYHKCAACGAKEMVDMTHKLCKYILAQDKKAKKDAKKKGGGKKGKEEKKKGKKSKDKDGSSDEEKKKKKDKKKDKKKKKDKSKDGDNDYIKDALKGGKKNDEDLDAAADDAASLVSEAGVDDEGAMDLAVEATRKYIVDNPPSSVEDLVELVTNQQMASALKSYDKLQILVRAAISPNTFVKNKEIQKFAPAISMITNGNRIMERHLISALEYINIDKPKFFPVMIKQMYDEDVLEEETILEWSEEGRSDYTLDKVDEDARSVLRGEAEPVVVWLQEAESDEESGDDE